MTPHEDTLHGTGVAAGAIGSAVSERTVTVTITLPVSWLKHINQLGEKALRGHDLYWEKQLCAKIMIAAIPKPTGRRYESVDALMADNPPNTESSGGKAVR